MLVVVIVSPRNRWTSKQNKPNTCLMLGRKCARFVILKVVIRKDLIQTLPLPRRLLDYLNYKHCYSEQIESDSSHSQLHVIRQFLYVFCFAEYQLRADGTTPEGFNNTTCLTSAQSIPVTQ
uniref:Uncharacterized protein n=1 Tax=Glossina austeni TaxID=7395 RepID=A0A1A9VP74_GLOAU